MRPATSDPRHSGQRPGNAASSVSTLRALGAGFRRLVAPNKAPDRLALDGLPESWATLAPGSVYLVYGIAGTPAADALLFESARDCAARSVTLVLSATRAAPLARLHAKGGGDLPARLNVVTLRPRESASDAAVGSAQTDAAARPLARLYGALRALKPFGFRRGSVFFVEGAEHWFSWDRPDDLAYEGRVLADWCETRNITLVLLAGRAAASTNDLALDSEAIEEQLEQEARDPERDAFHTSCQGVARLQPTHGELLWHVDFWRSRAALAAGEVRALRFTNAGRLMVAPEETEACRRADARIARDEMRVIATRKAVGDEPWVPAEWEIVDGLQAALKASLGARAASVVLDYSGGDQLETLCETIHTLRRTCGRALKIVLVERGQVLRHQFELLVLNLGANLVIGRDVPFSRMQSLMQSLRGQLNARPVAADYRAALAAALSDAVCGYLPVARFADHVSNVLGRGLSLNLPHVLVKLLLKPEVAHADALRQCRPVRNGDVFTADGAYLYVFLFACRLADAQGSLARIFQVPVESLAQSRQLIAGEQLLPEIERLRIEERRVPNVDFSDLFGAVAVAVAQDASQRPVETPTESRQETAAEATTPGVTEHIAQAPSASAVHSQSAPSDEANHAPQPDAATDHAAAQLRRRRRAEPAAMPLRKQEAL